MGVICLLHRYSKISAVRIPPKGLRITLEIREFGYLIIFPLGIPLGGAFKRSYREPSARSFDRLDSCTVIIHPKKTLCKYKNSPTAVKFCVFSPRGVSLFWREKPMADEQKAVTNKAFYCLKRTAFYAFLSYQSSKW